LDSIAPYVLHYLGALPGGGRKEHPNDPGIRPPSGVVKKMVEGGTEPKTTTILTFTGETTLERGTTWDISGLGMILQQRLHARLRDDMSGTYTVQASGSSSRVPTSTY